MKISRGKKIYAFTTLLLILLMLLPTSTRLMTTEFSQLMQLGNYKIFLPDILSIVTVCLAYVFLRMSYKYHAIYIKVFPIYMLLVVMFWTVLSQLK